jgi:hypothetical protein
MEIVFCHKTTLPRGIIKASMPSLKELIDQKKLKENPDLALKKEAEETNDHLEEIKERLSEPFDVNLPKELTEKAEEMATVADFVAALLGAIKGDKGDTGEQGEKGEKGDTGEKGDQGEPGLDGTNGIDGIDGKDGNDGRDGIDGKDGKDAESIDIESVVEKVVSKISKPQEKLLTMQMVDGLSQELEIIRKNIRSQNSSKGGSGMGNWNHQQFSTSSVTTTVTLSNNVAANSTALLVRYNGQLLAHGVQYTISGKTVSFTFTLDDSSTVDVTYVRS